MTTFAGQWGPEALINTVGAPYLSTAFTVMASGTSSPATLYGDRTKGSTVSNPGRTTDSKGNATFFVDPGSYDVVIFGVVVLPGIRVFADDADIGALIPPGTFAQAPNLPINVRDKGVTGVGVETTAIAAVLSAAPSGSEVYFPGPATYTTDMITVDTKVLHLRLADDAVLKLTDAATEVSGSLSVVRLYTSGSSLSGGTIDANKAGQNKTQYNTDGGAAAHNWYGVHVGGALGSPVTDVKVRTKVVNAPSFALNALYLDKGCQIDVEVDNCGGGVNVGYSSHVAIPRIAARTVDNAGWLIFQHFFDMNDCTDIEIGDVTLSDHFGSGAGLSAWNTGITWINCSDVRYRTIRLNTRNDSSAIPSVGASIIPCDIVSGSRMVLTGYTSLGLELASVQDSHLGHVHVDGRWQTNASAARGAGVAIYEIGFYTGTNNTQRTQRLANDLTFDSLTAIRHLDTGLKTSACRRIHASKVRLNGNRRGWLSAYAPAGQASNFTPQVIRDLTGFTFDDFVASYNEFHGCDISDARDLQLSNFRCNNNGQANTFPGGARADGATITNASGILTAASATGSPLVKSGWLIVNGEANDTQSWTDAGSAVSTNPSVLSVANDSLYNLGQTIKLTGAGAAGVDLVTRITDVSHDEITVSPAPSTFPTINGTCTISGTSTLTGTGTVFLTEIKGRFWITAAGQTRQVVKVSSDTVAVVGQAFSPALSGATFTVTKIVTVGLPSQNSGVVIDATVISPNLVSIRAAGNITNQVQDNTPLATHARRVGVEGQSWFSASSIICDFEMRARTGQSTQTSIGAVGPGGQPGVAYGLTTPPLDLAGSGTPEGSVAAPVGSTWRRTNGGAATSFYVKESGTGNTGWIAK